jgi:hypothetical protein
MPLTPISVAMISVAMISVPTVIPIIVFPMKAVRGDRRCFGDYRRCRHDTHSDEIAARTPEPGGRTFYG